MVLLKPSADGFDNFSFEHSSKKHQNFSKYFHRKIVDYSSINVNEFDTLIENLRW